MKKVSVGIYGGAGFTGGELLRILLFHPQVQKIEVQSSSQTHGKISDTHKDLVGYTDLVFIPELSEEMDIVFLCGSHGSSRALLESWGQWKAKKIVDLTQDFRISAEGNSFIYGLPELQREKIKHADHVANPGCFATAIQLALLPLAGAIQLNHDIHVTAITGSTGAGQAPSSTNHHSWRTSNISVYKAFAHQHMLEINQSLKQLQPFFCHDINLIPMRGDFTRGIFASLHFRSPLDQGTVANLYQDYYVDHPFVTVTQEHPDLKIAINTNMAFIHAQKSGDYLHITCAIDNLLKGASGQAVQNMNLLFGFAENSGLIWKPLGF